MKSWSKAKAQLGSFKTKDLLDELCFLGSPGCTCMHPTFNFPEGASAAAGKPF